MKSATKRSAALKRNTKETRIQVRFSLDGAGRSAVSTGIPFLDHMLELFAKHGLFDLDVRAQGDLHVDIHHTNEDVGISLGKAFAQAVGKAQGIRRFADVTVPLDEARSRAVVDVSARPFFVFESASGVKLSKPTQETFRSRTAYGLEDAKHFLRSFSQNAGLNLHVIIEAGEEPHHVLETIFKALAKALDAATARDARVRGVPSTKGRL